MKICIVGGGHISTALACYIKHTFPEYRVSLLTRKPERFAEELTCNDIEGGFSYSVKLDCISNDGAVAAQDAQLVYIALPHFAVEKAFSDVAPYVAEGAFIGVLPGSGGFEFFFEKHFGDRAHLFAFQRVPFTSKLAEYGREVNLKSWKPVNVIAAFRHADLDRACELVEACGLKTEKAANFLAVSLAPSNPILHTSRTYDLFGGRSKEDVFPECLKYYVGWTDHASRVMLGMDAELHALFDKMPEFDMSSVRPLTVHYEAPTIEAMTAKINSIPTFQTVFAPMKPSESGDGSWVADLDSRMFTEDFPWGLCIIRAYCQLFDVPAPTIDEVLGWYADFMGLEYYVDGEFCGRDLASTGIPQRYGITSPAQIIEMYRG